MITKFALVFMALIGAVLNIASARAVTYTATLFIPFGGGRFYSREKVDPVRFAEFVREQCAMSGILEPVDNVCLGGTKRSRRSVTPCHCIRQKRPRITCAAFE